VVCYIPLCLGGTTDRFRGVIRGTYDPETKKISASLKISWSSNKKLSGIDREGVATGEMVSGGFRGTWMAGFFGGGWTASGYAE